MKRTKQWKRADLHLHTPASADYEEPNRGYLEILKQAASRNLDIVAFTDHNTVAGYKQMEQIIAELEILERLNRLRPDEKQQLDEYRQLRQKVLVLPGFEFTATFGFHILAIFSDKTPLREIEYILLELHVPSEKLDQGSIEVGATSDVLTAYRVIDEAGGIVIAAHANTNNGVAMRGFDFGGQTRIAYTQDRHLHALEVTDLEKKGRRTTARFFNGSKPEYPRRMRCIQGSDSHRLERDPNNVKRLGIGDRAAELLLSEVSFEALRELFLGDDFARSRPYQATRVSFDHIHVAREEGPSIVQAFHEKYTRRGGRLYAIVADVCAFANTNGGTMYVGISADAKKKPAGIGDPNDAVSTLRQEIERKLTPPLRIAVDAQETQGVKVVRLVVPRGDDPPYAIEDNRIYIRDEAETNLAVRDEIVQLVRRNPQFMRVPADPGIHDEQSKASVSETVHAPPRTGVQIIASEERKGTQYHTMLDLRNGNVVKNVTRKSARRLWRYAITQKEDHPVSVDQVVRQGDIGILRKRKYRGDELYDLTQIVRLDGNNGQGIHVYYGVTEAGLHGEWQKLVETPPKKRKK